MIRKSRIETVEKLRKLFSSQLDILRDRGCPEKILNILAERERYVIPAYLATRVNQKRLPFLPVLTPAHLKLKELMAMLRYKEKRGMVMAEDMEDDRYPIVDVVGSQAYLHTYFDPYHILDVEDGTATEGLDTRSAYRKIVSKDRSPLTVAESISLCIFNNTLLKHSLWALGSRWQREERIPNIYSCLDGTPALFHEDGPRKEELWATASCARRVG